MNLNIQIRTHTGPNPSRHESIKALGGGNPGGFDFYAAKHAADSRCGTPVFAVWPHRDLIRSVNMLLLLCVHLLSCSW